MKEASAMVNNIISHYNLENISFDYDALTIQDVLNDYGQRKALGYDNKTVAQCIKDNFEGLFEWKTNTSRRPLTRVTALFILLNILIQILPWDTSFLADIGK